MIKPDPGLTAAVEALSWAYRSGEPPVDPGGHVHDARTASAYAAARMPATFASTGRAVLEGARSLPAFAPRTLLDVGAGTGAASWAAVAIWPSLAAVTLVERQPAMIVLGRRLALLAGPGPLAGARWVEADLATADLPGADVVIAGYLLGELDEGTRADLVDRLWTATRGAIVLVEPGSRAGFARILAARDRLIAAGGAVAAPCPGNAPCPVRDPEWCHFLARLERSPQQRRVKSATRSWEDEPYSYVVAARVAAEPSPLTVDPAARIVLGRPRHRPGRIELRVCRDGQIEPTIRSRRDGAAYRVARDLEWGDRVPSAMDPKDPPRL